MQTWAQGQFENEYLDHFLGRMIAVPALNSCEGCAYMLTDRACPDIWEGKSCCTPRTRTDKRDIIGIKADSN